MGVDAEARWGKASLKDASSECAGGVASAGAGSERMGIEVGVGCWGSALLEDDHNQPILSVSDMCLGVLEPLSFRDR